MNSSYDIASELTALRPSVAPSGPRCVFIPAVFAKHNDEMKRVWERWSGETDFVSDPERAKDCEICIFPRGIPNECAALRVKPFFDQHGLEANVFEYDDKAGKFVRINPAWLATYYPPLAQCSWDAFPYSPLGHTP